MDNNSAPCNPPVTHRLKEAASSLIAATLGNHGPSGTNHGQISANHGPSGSNHGQIGANHGQSGPNHGQISTSHGQSGPNHGQISANHGQSGANHSPCGMNHGQIGAANSQQSLRDNGSPLSILKEVQKAYEDRLHVIERVGGPKKMQMKVEILRTWVDDLVGQNALLAQVVEELETEATARLMMEKTKHQETEGELRLELCALRRRLARKDNDLRGLIEVLRRLREFDYCTLEGIHFFEVTESDIFGTVSWRQKKLDESGDTRRDILKQTKENIAKGNKFF